MSLCIDFFNGQKLIATYLMSDEKVGHKFEFASNFEYARIALRTKMDSLPVGEGGFIHFLFTWITFYIIFIVILTYSFLNEWSPNSGNEQWVPLSTNEERFLVAKDFNSYRAIVPCIRLRFELLESLIDSPWRERINISSSSQVYKPFVRSSYNNRVVISGSPVERQPQNENNTSLTSSKYKTASLRRKNNPDQFVTSHSEYRGKNKKL